MRELSAIAVLATLGYLFIIEWRMAPVSLITLPLGMVFFMLVMTDACTVAATNALNDTEVEYIGDIEVIRAFGKFKSSYEKFVATAKERAPPLFHSKAAARI